MNSEQYRHLKSRFKRTSRLSIRRLVTGWLGLVLVLANLLAGASLNGRSQATSFLDAPLTAGHIVVCTAAGMVEFDGNGHPVVPDGQGPQKDLCSFCLPLMQGGNLVLFSITATILPQEQIIAADIPPFAERQWFSIRSYDHLPSRAPPYSV